MAQEAQSKGRQTAGPDDSDSVMTVQVVKGAESLAFTIHPMERPDNVPLHMMFAVLIYTIPCPYMNN